MTANDGINKKSRRGNSINKRKYSNSSSNSSTDSSSSMLLNDSLDASGSCLSPPSALSDDPTEPLLIPSTNRSFLSRETHSAAEEGGNGASLLLAKRPWSIVLRNRETRQLVLYNRESQTVAVRSLQISSPMHRTQLSDVSFRTTSLSSSLPSSLAASASAASASTSHNLSSSTCPMCGHYIGRGSTDPSTASSSAVATADSSFIDAKYFWMLSQLHHSRNPPSPRIESAPYNQPARHTLLPISDVRALPSLSVPTPHIEPISLSKSSFNQGYYDRFFVEEKKLGRGQRGSVFLCQHVLDKVPLGEFAVKAIPVGTSHTWLVRMLKEVRLLERLKHINIIEYKHAWLEYRQLSLFGPEIPCLFVLMELANGGSLEEYLHIQWDPAHSDRSGHDSVNRRKSSFKAKIAAKRSRQSINSSPLASHEPINGSDCSDGNEDTEPIQTWPPPSLSAPISSTNVEDEGTSASILGGIGIGPDGKKVRYLTEVAIRSLFSDICHGLAHLHRHGIIHRDLKPPNLLIRFPDSHRSGIPRILISDFGECEVISDAMERERTGATGTLEFMPPELLQKNISGQYLSNHSTKADIWSLGVVLYYLCYSSVPYSQVDDVDQLKDDILNFRLVQFPESGNRVPEDIKELIRRLMQSNPDSRPTVEDILNIYEPSETLEDSSDVRSFLSSVTPRASIRSNIHVLPERSNISAMEPECDHTPINTSGMVSSEDLPADSETEHLSSISHTDSPLLHPNRSVLYRTLSKARLGLWIVGKIGVASLVCFPKSVTAVTLNTLLASILLDIWIFEYKQTFVWICGHVVLGACLFLSGALEEYTGICA
ncbi:hypothetical protein BASA83_001816 [Batrachochytrium salamandrivorans]|nr:hypothetical protein BASA83_001816 [Batrachochytrium salamandrivorans]